ncbi:hypothetical protein HKX48_004437 [Thoreauomyces humboldtii]|nr:hypothetical protein HKX48_004437 [Thoreauomyces humboldtii]
MIQTLIQQATVVGDKFVKVYDEDRGVSIEYYTQIPGQRRLEATARKSAATRAPIHLDNSTTHMDPVMRKDYLAKVTTDALASGMIHNLDVARNARIARAAAKKSQHRTLAKRCAGGADDTEGYIMSGGVLEAGDSLFSNSDDVQLAVQGDGNVVIYSRNSGSWQAIWATGTNGQDDPPFTLNMQQDGNLVFYADGIALWASGTAGTTYVALQDDGNLVMWADGGGRVQTVVWQTGATG